MMFGRNNDGRRREGQARGPRQGGRAPRSRLSAQAHNLRDTSYTSNPPPPVSARRGSSRARPRFPTISLAHAPHPHTKPRGWGSTSPRNDRGATPALRRPRFPLSSPLDLAGAPSPPPSPDSALLAPVWPRLSPILLSVVRGERRREGMVRSLGEPRPRVAGSAPSASLQERQGRERTRARAPLPPTRFLPAERGSSEIGRTGASRSAAAPHAFFLPGPDGSPLGALRQPARGSARSCTTRMTR